MSGKINQQTINNAAWAACDTLRGVMDATIYKDYILVMLFPKYISDVWKDHYDAYREKYGDDDTRIRRNLKRERFISKRRGGGAMKQVRNRHFEPIVEKFVGRLWNSQRRACLKGVKG